jgi:hypothetical protein
MKNSILAGLALFGFLGTALADDPKPAATPTPTAVAPKAEPKESYTVIGYLEKRDRVITIKSSSHGTVYSVAGKDGKVLFENVSAEQLKAQAPELHDMIKTGVAGDARLGTRPIRDARLGNSALQ